MTKLTKINIPENTWIQIGGDVNYTESIILAYYNKITNDIKIVDIQYACKEYQAQEFEYDVDELKEKEVESYGINYTGKEGLEIIAREEILLNGGDPINCDGQANYKYRFKTFKSALQNAINQDYFLNFEKIKIQC